MKTRKNNQEFNISNSRALGILVLIGGLFVFQLVTFVVEKFSKINNNVQAEAINIEKDNHHYFKFNPNTIQLDSLVLLGFTPKQAQSIINYKNKGGKFFKKEDFAKMYVVDSLKYKELEPYISIPDKKPANRSSVERKANVKREISLTNNTPLKKESTYYKSAPTKKNVSIPIAKIDTSGIYGKQIKKEPFRCNINTADSSTLVKLYGIGPYFAKKILQYRERLGGSFVNKNQLLEIEGFNLERLEKIYDKLVIDEKDIVKFSFWEVDKKFLETHPYIGAYAARGILIFIQSNLDLKKQGAGAIKKAFVQNNVISAEDGERLFPYIK